VPHAPPQVPPSERTLDNWLLNDFRKESVVFRASEPGYERRDPDAVENLARWLPYKGFSATKFCALPKGEDSWQQIVTDQPLETFCFVGRLGLFGGQAVEQLVNPETRFRFLRHSPPPVFPTGDELKKYYVIQEFDADQLVHEYRTEDTNGVRTDYGIVQRYPIYMATHWVTVLLCAGLSSLGTVGAARWLAFDLGLQDPVTQTPIIQPKAIEASSRVEALVRTIGASQSHIWRPSKIELVGLYVDHFQWSPKERQWHDIQQHVLQVRLRHGEPVAVLIDDETARLVVGSQNFRLVTTLAQQIGKNGGGGVDVKRLASDRTIWDGHELPPSKVKYRLHHLDDHTLRGLLTIDDQVRIDARVVVTEE
jgi:hypothetical protein